MAATLKLPELWGVINLTPDSFYAGSRFDAATALQTAEKFFTDGAAVIDVGAESTRPGAIAVPADVQLNRIGTFLSGFESVFGKNALRKISIDTRDITVMRAAAEAGVGYINDVSGGSPETYRLVAETGVGYVLMHSQGDPQTMQQNPQYTSVVDEVERFLRGQTALLEAAGVPQASIIWDTGIGFGKSVEHNLELIAAQTRFRTAGHRVLTGVSRKSFIGKILDQSAAEDRLIGTIAVQVYLTLRGLDILRLHDVKEMADALKLISAIAEHEL